MNAFRVWMSIAMMLGIASAEIIVSDYGELAAAFGDLSSGNAKITVVDNITAPSGSGVGVLPDLAVPKGVILELEGAPIVSGNPFLSLDFFKIFVQRGASLRISSLGFTGKGQRDVHNNGTLSVISCDFHDGVIVVNELGAVVEEISTSGFHSNTRGAILNFGVLKLLDGTSFKRISPATSGLSDLRGAIHNDGGNITSIQSCKFEGNGGKPAFANSGYVDEINACEFLNNLEGSIANYGPDGWIEKIVSSRFLGNKATSISSGVHNDLGGTVVLISLCEFSENTVNNALLAYGGIVNYGSRATRNGTAIVFHVDNCTFTKNGGGIANENGARMRISKCHFEGNFLDAVPENLNKGGAVRNSGTITSLTSSTFKKNGAYEGGGIYVSKKARVDLIDLCAFNGNTASGVNDEATVDVFGGGAISTDGEIGQVSNCPFDNNKADGIGAGGILVHRGATVEKVLNCEFNNNEAKLSSEAQNKIGGMGTIEYVENCPIAPPSYDDALCRVCLPE